VSRPHGLEGVGGIVVIVADVVVVVLVVVVVAVVRGLAVFDLGVSIWR